MKTRNLKNKVIGVAALLLSTAILGQSAMALTGGHGINKRQASQKVRIVQGIKSGWLTNKEALTLTRQLAKIHKKERRFKSDGKFTPRERAIIQRDLNKSSKNIHAQKHDWQVRWNARTNVRSPKINKRQSKQKRRIRQGIQSGALTVREALKLSKQQARIKRQERRFKADGRFTKLERRTINKHLKRSSKRIYRLKHNLRHR